MSILQTANHRLRFSIRLPIILCAMCVIFVFVMSISHVVVNSLWIQYTALRVTQKASQIDSIQESTEILERIRVLIPEDKNVLRLLGYANVDANNEEAAIRYWRAVPGIELELVKQGDSFWNKQTYEQAATWYARGLRIQDKLPHHVVFRCVIAAIMSDQPLPESCPSDLIPVEYFLQQRLQINGRDLQWLDSYPFFSVFSGEKLAPHPQVSPRAGVMWWAGTALSIVDVKTVQPVELVIRVQALSGDPRFNVIHDNSKIATFQTSEGEVSEFLVQEEMHKGLNIIGIEFLTDSGDLLVDSIEINSTLTDQY